MKSISTTMTEKNNQRDNTNIGENRHKEKGDKTFNRENNSRVSTNKS